MKYDVSTLLILYKNQLSAFVYCEFKESPYFVYPRLHQTPFNSSLTHWNQLIYSGNSIIIS